MGVSFLREIATNPARAAVMLLKLLAVLVSFVALCAAQERPRFPPAFMTDVRSRVARTLCVLLYLLAFSQLETVIDYICLASGSHRMLGQGQQTCGRLCDYSLTRGGAGSRLSTLNQFKNEGMTLRDTPCLSGLNLYK